MPFDATYFTIRGLKVTMTIETVTLSCETSSAKVENVDFTLRREIFEIWTRRAVEFEIL